MAFSIVQGGDTLYSVDTSGVATALTLPSGVTVDATKRARMAVINRFVVIGGSPSVNLVFDPNENVLRVFVPPPPASPPILSAGAGTGLTGAYKVRQSFLVKDENGAVVAESQLGPVSAAFTLANQSLEVEGVAISSEASVNARRLYRTTAGGEVYFPWIDLDGNVTSSIDDNMPDASLEDLPGDPALGSPPGTTREEAFALLLAWGGRLWGRSTKFERRDYILASEDSNNPWAWDLSLVAAPQGVDEFGITGFLPRRDELVVGRRNRLLRVIDTAGGDTPYEVRIIAENVGVLASDSCIVIRDVGYFLWYDGVYSIGPNGVECVSRQNVHAWFTTDDYFNRAEFDNAFGCWDPVLDCYRLFLAPAGSTDITRYVDFYLSGPYAGKWLGPHKTDAFTPTYGGLVSANGAVPRLLLGASNGYLHTTNSATRRDGQSTAIALSLEGKFHSGAAPDITHYWGQASVLSKVETGGTLVVTPKVGRLDASAGAAMNLDLTLGRQRTPRLGVGALAQLTISNSDLDRSVTVYGYEIPFSERGRR